MTRSNAERCRENYAKNRNKRLAAKKAARGLDPESARVRGRAMYAKHREKRVAEARAKRSEKRQELAAKALAKYRRERNAILARRRELRKRPEARAKASALVREWYAKNPDKAELHHAKRLLADQTGARVRDIPDDIAEAKAEQLKITRWVREQTQNGKTGLEKVKTQRGRF